VSFPLDSIRWSEQLGGLAGCDDGGEAWFDVQELVYRSTESDIWICFLAFYLEPLALFMVTTRIRLDRSRASMYQQNRLNLRVLYQIFKMIALIAHIPLAIHPINPAIHKGHHNQFYP
jgi:hypothetical protein